MVLSCFCVAKSWLSKVNWDKNRFDHLGENGCSMLLMFCHEGQPSNAVVALSPSAPHRGLLGRCLPPGRRRSTGVCGRGGVDSVDKVGVGWTLGVE